MSALEELITAAGESTTDPGLPQLRIDGATAIITLNRPDHRNRLSPIDIERIETILDELEKQSSLRAVVFTGTGPVFCSGFNLNVFYDVLVNPTAEGGSRETRAEDNFFGDFTDRIENCALPTILAANGPVYGGGTDFALACDFRFAVEGVKAFLPASRLGIHFYDRGLERYVSRLGLAAAKRLCLTAETLHQDELLRCGFFDAVYSETAMWDRVNELTATLAKQAPLAVRGMKRALNQIAYQELDKEATQRAFLECLNSQDFKEGVSAWAEKRDPEFSGT